GPETLGRPRQDREARADRPHTVRTGDRYGLGAAHRPALPRPAGAPARLARRADPPRGLLGPPEALEELLRPAEPHVGGAQMARHADRPGRPHGPFRAEDLADVVGADDGVAADPRPSAVSEPQRGDDAQGRLNLRLTPAIGVAPPHHGEERPGMGVRPASALPIRGSRPAPTR